MSIKLDLHSETGRKTQNDDALAHSLDDIPKHLQDSHGQLFIIADGVSAAEKGGKASRSACKTFMQNYYKSSPNWRPKAMANQLLSEINLGLYNKGIHEFGDGRKGYACTFSALLIKGNEAHIFHIGDTRIYRRRDSVLEQLTKDHSSSGPNGHTYLDNALGVEPLLQFEYYCVDTQQNDEFLLSCDGVHEVLKAEALSLAIEHFDAKALVQSAYDNNSSDNLSCLMVRIMDKPEARPRLSKLPNVLSLGNIIDDLRVGGYLFSHNNYHYYRCQSLSDKSLHILKYPNINSDSDDSDLDEKALHICDNMYLEQWQLNKSEHSSICKPAPLDQQESAHYIVLDHCEGIPMQAFFQSIKNLKPKRLVQWMEETLKVTLELKRLGLNHSALTPHHIFVTENGELRFFCIALNLKGLASPHDYAAPEQFLYPPKKSKQKLLISSDVVPELFSCALIIYEYLSEQTPYRFNMYQLKSKIDLQRLSYHSIITERPEVPLWFDAALKKALSLYPENRYQTGASFIADLLQPNTDFLDKGFITQYSRKLPVFPLWKLICVLWATSIVIMGVILFSQP